MLQDLAENILKLNVFIFGHAEFRQMLRLHGAAEQPGEGLASSRIAKKDLDQQKQDLFFVMFTFFSLRMPVCYPGTFWLPDGR